MFQLQFRTFFISFRGLVADGVWVFSVRVQFWKLKWRFFYYGSHVLSVGCNTKSYSKKQTSLPVAVTAVDCNTKSHIDKHTSLPATLTSVGCITKSCSEKHTPLPVAVTSVDCNTKSYSEKQTSLSVAVTSVDCKWKIFHINNPYIHGCN